MITTLMSRNRASAYAFLLFERPTISPFEPACVPNRADIPASLDHDVAILLIQPGRYELTTG